MAPGDPAAVLAGEAGSSDPAYVEQLRREFGLDQPVYVQLGTYLKASSSSTWAIRTANACPCWT